MGEVYHEASKFMCAEVPESEYFDNGYDCTAHENSFNFAYRFFRMVFKESFERDFDGISRGFRIGSPDSCRRVLGLGLYNCLLYTSPSPRDLSTSRMPSSA